MVDELVLGSSILAEMVTNTLDISKLESGKAELCCGYHSIRSVIEIVLKTAQQSAQKKEVKLRALLGSEVPSWLEFDRVRVTQVIVNLVSNAIKFTPAAGCVEVRAKWTWRCGHNGGDCNTCESRIIYSKAPIELHASPDKLCEEAKDPAAKSADVTFRHQVVEAASSGRRTSAASKLPAPRALQVQQVLSPRPRSSCPR